MTAVVRNNPISAHSGTVRARSPFNYDRGPADWGKGRRCENCGEKMSRYTPPPRCWKCEESDRETRAARKVAWLASGGVPVSVLFEPAGPRETPGARRKRVRYEVLEVLLDQFEPKGTTFVSGALLISKNASWKRLLTLSRHRMVTKRIEKRSGKLMDCGQRAQWGLTRRGRVVGLLLRHGPLTTKELNGFMLLDYIKLAYVLTELKKDGVVYSATDDSKQPIVGLLGISKT